MAALDTMLRLAGLAVERERRTLLSLQRQAVELEARLAQLQAATEAELRQADLPLPMMPFLLRYVAGCQQQAAGLAGQLAALERTRQLQQARLAEQRQEHKRLERLCERREAARQAAAERRERSRIDDLVAGRAARAGRS